MSEMYSSHDFLYYLQTKRELVNMLNLNHPNLQCDIKDICNTKFPKFEKEYDELTYYEYEVFFDYEFDFDDDSIIEIETCSFCDLYFMFEHKTKFVILVDHLKLWLFSRRNFTIHSNQFTNKFCFFSRR